MKEKLINIIGLGYIGLPTAAILSKNGFKVYGTDLNKDIVDTINKGEIHITEPDLDKLVRESVKSGNLKAFINPQPSDIYIICVPTPLKKQGGLFKPEIGCIELDNLIPTKNIFHFYLNPERKVSEKAFEVHGYSDEFLATKQKFADIADDFIDFIKDKKIIIHNAEFDIGHLNNELTLIGKPKISTANVIDTLELARNKFPGSGISLDV